MNEIYTYIVHFFVQFFWFNLIRHKVYAVSRESTKLYCYGIKSRKFLHNMVNTAESAKNVIQF